MHLTESALPSALFKRALLVVPFAVMCIEAFDGELGVMGRCQALLLHRILHLQGPEKWGRGKWVVKEQERISMK